MNIIPRITTVRMKETTQYAPLCVLGAHIRHQDILSPILSRMEFPERMHIKEPWHAILDLWISILAGCRSVSQVNTKIRPDHLLAKAWGRDCFHEQSTLARVLDACSVEQVMQLRTGVEAISRWIGQAGQHPWHEKALMVDIDLTGMPAGRKAEGSTKGYFSGKRGCAAVSFAE